MPARLEGTHETPNTNLKQNMSTKAKSAQKKIAASAKLASVPAAAKPTKKVTALAIHPVGTIIKFEKYADEATDPLLTPGEKYSLGDYFPEQEVYNVHAIGKGGKPGKKALDCITVEEFTLVQAEGAEGDDQLTVVDASEEVPATTKGKGKKAAAVKAAKPEKAAKAKKEEPAQEPLGPVKVTNSVKEAIKSAGGDPLAAASALFDGVEHNYFILGGVLSVAQEKDAHASILGPDDLPLYEVGQKGFAKWVEATLGMKYRKAQYLAETYRTITEAGIPESKISGIGWAKLKEGLRFIKGGGDVDTCIKLAKENTTSKFKAEIKKKCVEAGIPLHGHDTGGHEMTTYKVSIFNDQATVMEQALTRAAEALGVTPPSEDKTQLGACLMHIVNEWMTTQG